MTSQLDTLSPGRGVFVYGAPFTGKTYVAKRIPGALEFDELLQPMAADRGPEFKRAWRTEHPQHAEFAEMAQAIRQRLEQHVRDGGVALAHDPLQADDVQQVRLTFGPDEREQRLQDWLKTGGSRSRQQALEHYEQKPDKGRSDPQATSQQFIDWWLASTKTQAKDNMTENNTGINAAAETKTAAMSEPTPPDQPTPSASEPAKKAEHTPPPSVNPVTLPPSLKPMNWGAVAQSLLPKAKK